MIIKRYRVKNMNEAITRIKHELGKDAVIISQRKVRKGGFLGLFSRKILEVTASVDNSKSVENVNYSSTDSIEAFKKAVIEKSQNQNRHIQTQENGQLVKEVQEMKKMMDSLMQNSYKTLGKSKLELQLENSDLNSEVVDAIMVKMNDIKDDIGEDEKLKRVIGDMVKVQHKVLEKVVVLVGPTGVGKTTTIAKLAGRISLIEKKSVGLITIDTYRIGAVEQLRTYADIINIPFKVALTIKDIEKAVEEMAECDVILVDTTGRSSKNKMQISELRAFIDRLNTDNVHLVISCTTKNSDIGVIVDSYRKLNFNNVIITKLDETSTYGSILNIVEVAKKPISFVTTGQNVPEDIRVMDSEEIAKLVLGEEIIC